MSLIDLDENGWARGAVAPLLAGEAWTLLSPEPDARMDTARWAHQAQRFFRARLAIDPEKRYPNGTLPLADRAVVRVEETEVLVVTVPADRAPELIAAAMAGVRAIGGAGMDALVARAKRIWQVRAAPLSGTEERAPLVLTAMLASLLLAPVVPPGGGTIFGVKGARERLAAMGWRS